MTVALRQQSSRKWEYLPQVAQAQVPRYTSYPPANRFSSSTTSETALGAIRRLPARASLSLYLHVPFCKALCWYCGCHTGVPTKADPVATYVNALAQEIELV